MKTVGIFTGRVDGLEPWDPDTVDRGMGGSEEAVVYISQKLAELGMRVFVFGMVPEKSRHSLDGVNPQFVDPRTWSQERLDVAISWRMVQMGKALRPIADKVYLWPHDTCVPRFAKDEIEAFDDVLWLSEWQRMQWSSVNPLFGKFRRIFGNGVNPEHFEPISERENPFSCIYGSNYGRGLEELIELWPAVRQKFPLATLDIYYGWQSGWGMFSEAQEKLLRGKIERLPGVNEHGQVGHNELNRAYERASFWTYPCKWPETFCITALRAQFAGAVPVIIQNTGLNETVPHGYRCKRGEEYLPLLLKALGEAPAITLEERKEMADFILKDYTWKGLAEKWKRLFNEAV